MRWLEAISCFLVAATFLLASSRVSTVNRARYFRSHLTDFGKAWLVLGLAYVAVWVANLKGADTLASIVIVAICAYTNVQLLRAVFQILPMQTKSTSGIAVRKRDRSLYRNAFWITLVSPLFALGIVLLGLADDATWSRIALGISLLPSCGLLGWLAIVYRNVRVGTWSVLTMFVYAIFQIAYLIVNPKDNSMFHAAFAGAKLMVAIVVPYQVYIRARDGELARRRTQQLAEYLEVQAGLALPRRIGRILLVTVTAMVILYLAVVALSQVWAWNVGDNAAALLVIHVIATVCILFAVQAVAFLMLRSGPQVNWEHQAKNALSGVLTWRKRETFDGWSAEVITPNAGTYKERNIHVVLLHGFASTSHRAWAQLPAIMAAEDDVAAVHLVGYQHSLWSRDLVRLGEELVQVLLPISKEGRMVIFAHSLGGMIAIRALARSQRLRDRLMRLVCVATPLLGSPLAFLGYPWSWPRDLRIGSKYVRDVLEEYTKTFLPAGPLGVGAYRLPAFSLLYGTKDRAVWSLVSSLVPMIRVPAEHGSVTKVTGKGDLAECYLNELRKPPSLELMKLVGESLAACGTFLTGYLFCDGEAGGLDGAAILSPIDHRNTTPPGLEHSVGAVLRQALHQDYTHLTRSGADVAEKEFGEWWLDFCKMVDSVRNKRYLIRKDWPGDGTAYLLREGGVGFVVVVAEQRLKGFRRRAA